MALLIFFSFLAGVVTILSPCILPILPIVLSGGLGGGKARPIGVVFGFIVSFTFFTLALASIVKATGISADALRNFSILIILGFGLTLLIPQFQQWISKLFSVFSHFAPVQNQNDGFFGGTLLGLSIGLIWTPCVGPIIASVITLAAANSISTKTVLIMLAYAAGTGIPMLAITYGGRQLLQKLPWLLSHTEKIQKIFGAIMILTAVGIFFNIDRQFQTFIVGKFPSYGAKVTQLENTEAVKKELSQLFAPQAPTPPTQQTAPAMPAQQFPTAPELIPGGMWFNSAPLNLASLRGKVVLVDFWTYTCINCIRTLPYLQSWHEKYSKKGLVIIGVHTPEFEFEKNPANVEKAIKSFGLTYPVMQDNDYATWNAYDNHYWPAKYFIDKNGLIRDSHFGEGDYDTSEKFIQQLLEETGADVGKVPVNNPQYSVNAGTPETYVGYARAEYSVSPEEIKPDKMAYYSTPSEVPPNRFAYGGMWTIGSERASPSAGASLTIHFSAQNVFLVMRSRNGTPGKIKMYLDGKIINSELTVKDDRLYSLVHLSAKENHLLKLEFLDSETELYAFTFG